jgi:outer membrane murein-binding lipoprotein Lpp
MRNLITIISLAACLLLGWQYQEMSAGKTASEAKVGELSKENETLKSSVKTLSTRIAQMNGGGPAAQGGQPANNWIADRNRNWKNPLTASPVSSASGGKGRQRGATSTPTPTPFPPPTPAYYTDAQGRYWLDSSGGKHYVP